MLSPMTHEKAPAVRPPAHDRDWRAIAPEPGEVTPLLNGLGWTRIPLPYEPYHVNVYLFEEEDGWVVVDTGLDDTAGRAAWITLLTGTLRAKPIRRIIVTHWHNDHLGLAGWLAELTGAQILMSRQEFFRGALQSQKPTSISCERERRHLLMHGTNEQDTSAWLDAGFSNLSRISPLPHEFDALAAGAALTIGPRRFTIIPVAGHSLSGVALYCADDNFLLCGDHLSPEIVPNISVMSDAPDSNPHAEYVATIPTLRGVVPDDALLLPGHEYPFVGLAATINRIAEHHAKLCNRILGAATHPCTAAELTAQIVRNPPSTMWLGFVVGRVLGYAHFLVSRGRLSVVGSELTVSFVTVDATPIRSEDFGAVTVPVAGAHPNASYRSSPISLP